MRAGRMDKRVRLLEKQVARDALGGEVITWAEQAEVWCEVAPVRGHEYFAAQEVNPEYITLFRIRYDAAPTMTNAWRLEWRGQQYDIEANLNVNAQDHVWEIMAHTAQS